MGAAGDDKCPTNYERITSAAACTEAARTMVSKYNGVSDNGGYVGGCFVYAANGEGYLNPHAGGTRRDSRLLCAKDPGGPSHHLNLLPPICMRPEPPPPPCHLRPLAICV